MYGVVFTGLLALNHEGGPSRFSVDYLIEQRVSWWHRIAEVGHRAQSGELLHRGPVPSIAPPVAGPPMSTDKATADEPPVISSSDGDEPTVTAPAAQDRPLATSGTR